MDIDIDLQTSFVPEKYFKSWTRASIFDDKNKTYKPHPCGVFPQAIPRDPITGLSAIPYDIAAEADYIKIDFLHLSIYDHFSSRAEIEELVKKEPNWDLLADEDIVKKLFQLSNHFKIVSKIKPRSIEDLADALALIRPGKKTLENLYVKDKNSCRKILYQKNDDEFSFKKSHAISYAMVICLQLHLIEKGIEF